MKFYTAGIALEIQLSHIPYLVNMDSLKEDIEREIEYREGQVSRWKPDSVIGQINRNAGIAEVKVDFDIFNLLKNAKEIGFLTKGDFKFLFSTINNKLASIDSIVLNKTRHTVFLKEKEDYIDLKNLAEGYILDQIVNALKAYGIHNMRISSSSGIKSVLGKNKFLNWKINIKINRLVKSDVKVKKDLFMLEKVNDLLLIGPNATVIAAIGASVEGLDKIFWKKRFNSFKDINFLFYDTTGRLEKSLRFEEALEIEK